MAFAKIRQSKKLILYGMLKNVVGGNVKGSDDLGQDEEAGWCKQSNERLIIPWIYWSAFRLSASTELRVTISL